MNRYDVEQVTLSLPLLEEEPSRVYAYVQRVWKDREVSARYPHGNYHTNAPLISLSGCSIAKKICLCGTPGHRGIPSYCRQFSFCNICARKAASRVYVRFQDAFAKAPHWYALTYSYRSNVFLGTATKAEFLSRWEQASSFVRSLLSEQLINGAFAVKETSINSLAGSAVFPHLHVVMNSDRSDLLLEDGTLHPTIAAEAARLDVSLKVTRITDEQFFLNEVKYPIKPINLKAIYEEEAPATTYPLLNAAADLTLRTMTAHQYRVQRLKYYGNMDARCKGKYIGTVMRKQTRKGTARQQYAGIHVIKRSSRPTKELKSRTLSPIMKAERSNTATMPLPAPAAPVLPPQKKRSLWGPIALGAGAGALGLGAADMFLNKGQASHAIFNTLKNTFSGNQNGTAGIPSLTSSPVLPTPAPAKHVAPLYAANPNSRGGADTIADMAAGYVGNHENHNYPDVWKDFVNNGYQAGAENAFKGVPGNTVSDSVADHAWNGVAAADTASLGHLGLQAGAAGLDKVMPSAPGLSALKSFNARPVWGTLGRASGAATSLLGGYDMGANPLSIEAMMDKLGPEVSPEAAANISKTKGLTSGAALAMSPLGWITAPAGAAVLNDSASRIRNMAGSVEERGAVSDIIARLSHGAKTGNPMYQQALQRVIHDIDANPELSRSINQGSGMWFGTQGSPALKHLIDQSRQ